MLGGIINKADKIFRGVYNIYKLVDFKKKRIFIMNLRGIGDTCVQCTYLRCYLEKNHISNEYAIIVAENLASIVEEYGLSNIIKVKSEKTMQSMYYVCNSRLTRFWINALKKRGIIVMDVWHYVTEKEIKLGVDNANAIDIMRKRALRLNESAEIRQAFPEAKGTSYFEGEVIKQKFIVINPFSKSMNLPMEIFEYLAKAYCEKGYKVYTNTNNVNDVLKYTEMLDVSIAELADISQYADAIISVRSGILDYIISKAKRIIAIYDEESVFCTLYTLEAWDTDCEVAEIIYDGNKMRCVEAVMDVLN